MNLSAPKNWKIVRLGDVASKIFSGGTPSTQNEKYYGGGIPWLRTQEVNFNYIYDTDIKITEEGFKSSSAKWVPANSVIIAMYGNSAGRVAYSTIPLTTNQACCNIVVDPEQVDSKFLYFRLLKDYTKLEGMATGGAQQNLSVGVLKDYEIPLPPLPEQREIAALLGSLDDKIELLRAENKTLEALAQTLFREWFVEFRYPGHESVTMVDGIPEGWRIGKLGEFTIITSGKRPLKIHQTKTAISPYPLIGATSVMGYVEEYLFDQEVFVIGRVGTHGQIQRFSEKIYPSDNTLVLSSEFQNFLYQILKTVNFEQLNKGAVQPLITQSDMKAYEVIIPPKEILSDFETLNRSISDKVKANDLEVKTLFILRDQLLGKIFAQ